MKKIYIFLIINIIYLLIGNTDITNANTEIINGNTTKTTVIVTEEIPWANCKCFVDNVESDKKWKDCWTIETRKYKCTIEPWFGSFQKSIQGITGWFTQIALILSVLVVVLLGIAWAIWGSSEEKVKFLKWWTINILIGIVTLFFFQYILVMLAPWVFK